MQTSPEQLAAWLAEPEGLRLEFKEANNRFDFDKLVSYCVALANEGGGKIIFGVTDRRPQKLWVPRRSKSLAVLKRDCTSASHIGFPLRSFWCLKVV